METYRTVTFEEMCIRDSFFAEQIGCLMGTVAAEDYQAIQLHLLVIVLHVFDFIHAVFVDDTHQLKWLPRSAQNGAAERKDAGKIFRFHALIIAFDQAAVTVVNAINFHIVAEFFIQRFCNAANSCIEADVYKRQILDRVGPLTKKGRLSIAGRKYI